MILWLFLAYVAMFYLHPWIMTILTLGAIFQFLWNEGYRWKEFKNIPNEIVDIIQNEKRIRREKKEARKKTNKRRNKLAKTEF